MVIGLGSVGMRVVEGLRARGCDVAVVERDEHNRYIAQARSLGVPVVIGDATLAPTLEAVNVSAAAGVAVMTSDDLANVETGLAVRDELGERWASTPVVLRVFDRALGRRLRGQLRLQPRVVDRRRSRRRGSWARRSASACCRPSTSATSRSSSPASRVRDRRRARRSLRCASVGARIRVIAIRRAAEAGRLEHPPRRDTRFEGGDEAFLVGPYEELLHVVRRERATA